MAEKADVVMIGGYAGVMAANRLARREDVTVTLINPLPPPTTPHTSAPIGTRSRLAPLDLVKVRHRATGLVPNWSPKMIKGPFQIALKRPLICDYEPKLQSGRQDLNLRPLDPQIAAPGSES
ncbi:hypothetical protein J7E99_38865 [Streptomyces sp. ISL-44]|nr:hypothetical protein [Streptomyces sp. ISL-44]MBT2546466.1 hypothetical protein [Streptomyces sp. ISL-44]